MKKTVKKDKIEFKIAAGGEPMMASYASEDTKTRRNRSGTIERTDRFKNIDEGMMPFKFGANKSYLSIRDTVILCQKAYYNFSVFRNIIDLMTEFSVSKIYYRGGNAKARAFFEALFGKINIDALQDKYFREYYRSGNVFVYRFDGKVRPSDIEKITKVYAGEISLAGSGLTLPSRYMILNPADVAITGGLNFGLGRYVKVLSDYELERVKNPQTDEDRAVLAALPEEERKRLLKRGGSSEIYLPLSLDKVSAIFYKKQDYEPFAVPMGYPVLEDINAKAEMKKMDMAIARTMQQAILLVTMGAKPEEGGINQKNIEAMQKLFANESAGRVLIADYTTKAEFVIPQIADILDPKKYEVLDRDINIGLNNIFVGSEKFANQASKVEVFLARLTQARETFISEFLLPEIKRIAKELGMKNYPTPYFDEIEMKDNVEFAKVYSRLAELGLLTADETIKAIETNRLPDPESSLESQKAFKEAKDKGYYAPLTGSKTEGEAGKPPGAAGPTSVTPMGSASVASEEAYSFLKVKENMLIAQELEEAVASFFKEKAGIKKLNKEQKSVVEEISMIVMANEEPKNWVKKAAKYCEKPIDTNPEKVAEIHEIAASHHLPLYLASLLQASKVK